jgi:hypothetical protein
MSEEITEEVQHNPFNVDAEDVAKAGLWVPAPYNFLFKSMKPVERTVNSGPREGETYHVISGRLEAFEVAIYDEEGNLESIEEVDPVKGRYHDFAIQGNGLKALKTAYKSITGQNPAGILNEDTGRYELDLVAIAEELVGSTAWNNVFHTEPNDQGNVYDRLTYTFRKDAPQRYGFAKRTTEAAVA